MKYYFLLALIIANTSFAFSQKISCAQYSATIAKQDIRNGHPKLLFQGGIAPIVYAHKEKFESIYKVKYIDFGCVAPENHECIYAYNFEVFKFLDKTYKKEWRKWVDKKALGYETYIKKGAP